jgi:broad specificity phosphatase PhoE
MRYVELYRHTDNDDDALSPEGVSAAEAIGGQLKPPYAAFVSTGAARATQMLEILRDAAGQQDVAITQEPGLRSAVEDRWRSAAKTAGKGADLEDIRRVDPDLVEKESALLGGALRRVVDRLDDGQRALVVGHSPTNEAAVLGLTAAVIPPLDKGAAVLVTEGAGRYRAQPLT